MIGRQLVTGISAARCVFPIPFPYHCMDAFSLPPCPPVQVQFQKKLQDLFEMEPARIRAHYRTWVASGDKRSQGHNRALLPGVFFFLVCFAPSFDWSMPPLSLAPSLIVACGAEADVLDLCCGICGGYRYSKDKAEALLSQEEGCAPSGEYWFASMCVSPHTGYTCTRVLYPLVPVSPTF